MAADDEGGDTPAEDDPAALDFDPESVDPESVDVAELSDAELRAYVEARYDFDDFGPADMAAMTAAEWEAAFDPESWVTGADLLDRVQAELDTRVANREVFAVIERLAPDHLIAYSDAGYASVSGDGSVEGRGTVLRDVKPTVALCSMPEYEPPEPPDDADLPAPATVPEGGGDLGHRLLQAVAAALLLCGIALLGSVLLGAVGSNALIALVTGVGFLGAGAFLFVTVANARLADRFRADEFRNRLRAAGVDADERPAFLPDDAPRDGETGASTDEPPPGSDGQSGAT